MDALLWIVVGLLTWVVVAVAFGVLLGRSIRVADRVGTERPYDELTPTTPDVTRVAVVLA
ncbi:hypothetical protein ACI780_15530 [Geodermatophilus sp. SYSU D00814]